MTDRRHYRRYAVNCSGHFYDDRSKKYVFQLNNISPSGMNITTGDDFTQTQIYSISLNLTGLPLPRAKQLKGEVVRKKRNKAVFNYSIRFVGLTDADIIELDEFLRYIHNNTFNTSIMMYKDNDWMFV